MKFLLTLWLVAFQLVIIQAQADKKLKKLMGYTLTELEAGDNYHVLPDGDIQFHYSNTFKGDTIGLSNQAEYLMFKDDIVNKSGELFKLFRINWVTNSEYNAFLNWVKDSITLEKIYLNTDPTGNNTIPDELIGEMLNHPDIYYDSINLEYTEFDPSQPFINRMLFPLSWRTKGIYDYQIVPLISDMYYRPNERFNKEKTIDERKFYYGEKGSGKEIFVAPDRISWAKDSKRPYDLNYNIANYYSYEEPCEYFPVVGLQGTQIKAYLDYRENILQERLDNKGYDYTVHLSLPIQDEIKNADTSDCDCKMEFPIEEKDMTDHWRITHQDYWDFLSWVQDSILRESIYYNDNSDKKLIVADELIGDMLDYDDVYYDEVNLAWQEFDPSQPFINRGLFSLDFDFDWKKKIDRSKYLPLIKDKFTDPENFTDSKGNVDHKKFEFTEYTYQYSWEDLNRKAQDGELKWDEEKKQFMLDDNWAGKDLDPDTKNLEGFKTGVRTHKDISLFIIEEYVSVYPGIKCVSCNQLCAHEHGEDLTFEESQKVCDKCPKGWDAEISPYDFWSDPEGLMQGLTFDQAKAFYNWKYHRHTLWEKTNTRFFDDLLPTEGQFKKIQSGETVIVPAQDIRFPTPFFRYVIHFYPK